MSKHPTSTSFDEASTVYADPKANEGKKENTLVNVIGLPEEEKALASTKKQRAKTYFQITAAIVLSGGIYPLYKRIRRCQTGGKAECC
ncbi:hypothetical protein LPJ81_002142 [Coemansia sp. IMI 209127]|nr:hypothetical protein LPJ81_002142 [Coemansia sp. IMI 209127]